MCPSVFEFLLTNAAPSPDPSCTHYEHWDQHLNDRSRMCRYMMGADQIRYSICKACAALLLAGMSFSSSIFSVSSSM